MFSVINKRYFEAPVGDLIPHPSNYNQGDLASISESVDVNGFYGATIVREHPTIPGHYQILAGEHRWRTAVEKGAETIPVIEVEAPDEVAAARILLADNETAKRSTYNTAKLDDLLNQLGSIEGTGFDLADLEDHEERRRQAEPPEEDEEPEFAREFGVIVMADDEQHQRALYEELKGRGLTVRVASI